MEFDGASALHRRGKPYWWCADEFRTRFTVKRGSLHGEANPSAKGRIPSLCLLLPTLGIPSTLPRVSLQATSLRSPHWASSRVRAVSGPSWRPASRHGWRRIARVARTGSHGIPATPPHRVRIQGTRAGAGRGEKWARNCLPRVMPTISAPRVSGGGVICARALDFFPVRKVTGSKPLIRNGAILRCPRLFPFLGENLGLFHLRVKNLRLQHLSVGVRATCDGRPP